MALNNTFFNVIDLKLKKEPDPRIAKLALEAARRADELTKGKNIAILDTLAVALYRTGDPAGAVATEEKAIKQLEAAGPRKTSRTRTTRISQAPEQIEKFRKAAAEKGGKAEKP